MLLFSLAQDQTLMWSCFVDQKQNSHSTDSGFLEEVGFERNFDSQKEFWDPRQTAGACDDKLQEKEGNRRSFAWLTRKGPINRAGT